MKSIEVISKFREMHSFGRRRQPAPAAASARFYDAIAQHPQFDRLPSDIIIELYQNRLSMRRPAPVWNGTLRVCADSVSRRRDYFFCRRAGRCGCAGGSAGPMRNERVVQPHSGDARKQPNRVTPPPIVMARLVRATSRRTCRNRWPGQAGP